MTSSHPTLIRVEIPMLPPAKLNPNWRGHWSKRAPVAATFRAAAKLYALQASKYSRPRFPYAEYSVTLVIPNRRHIRDGDNTHTSLKPAIDGVVDAEIIRDDKPGCLTCRHVHYQVDKDRAPLTIIEISPVKQW